MKLGTSKKLSELLPVLKDPQISQPEFVYYVFSEISKDKWANNTVLTNELLGSECAKTFGHYHPDDAVPETYRLIAGEGVMQLQKKKMDNGQIVPDQVEEVFLVKAVAGDEIVITQEFGHSWSNTGEMALISVDDWRSGHTPADYAVIEQQKGMAYYLVKENGEIKAIPNPTYKNLPEPVWVTAEEFKNRS